MKTSSAKQKGRRLVLKIRETLLAWCPDLSEDDIKVPPTSVPGEDLWLSPKAREVYPLCIEAKNQEALNIWAAIAQAKEHAKGTGHRPVVVFSRNREPDPQICMSLEDFLWFIS